jgi:hypothetical protein
MVLSSDWLLTRQQLSHDFADDFVDLLLGEVGTPDTALCTALANKSVGCRIYQVNDL